MATPCCSRRASCASATATTARSPSSPGAVYEIALDLQPTGNAFRRDHRIRLDVTSSTFPEFDANPNTGEPLGKHTHTVVAHQTIFHDAAHPSRIILPVAPSRAPLV